MMRVQRSCWSVLASALVCLPIFGGAANSRGQEPYPPEVIELFATLGIEVDDQGMPVLPPPEDLQPFVPPTIDPVEDPLAFFASLGIPVGDITIPPEPPAPPVPVPVVEPTPVFPSPAELELFGLLGLEFDEDGNLLPIAPPETPVAPPVPVPVVEPTPVFPSPAELELFGLLGLEFDEDGNLLPPAPPEPPVAPPVVIDTEQEVIDFFASIGIVLDEDGNPIAPMPPLTPTTAPADPHEFLLSLGMPVELVDAPLAVAAATALSIPEPSSAVLVLGFSAGLLTRRGRRK